ncbi:MAG: hypothetical protein ACREDA_07470, partial [Methylocella sp.]
MENRLTGHVIGINFSYTLEVSSGFQKEKSTMSPSAISTNDAWALCAWADTLYVKTNPFKPPPPPSPPPPPWNAVF